MNRTKRTRLTAFLLSLACLISLFPITALSADAPESTITLRAVTWTSTTYQSDYFARQCQIQHFQMNVGGQVLSGFCGDHSKRLNNNHIGDTWSTPQEVTDPVVKTMIAYYYTHMLGEEYYNDACIAKGFNYQVSEDVLLSYNGWIQEVVWLWSTDQIPSDHDGQVEIVAQAFRESANARNGTSYASIDDPTSPGSPNTFREVSEMILSNPECWCECPVYRYVHPDSDIQPILVGYPKKAPHTIGYYEISVRKVDVSNPSHTLSGATFRLESTTDSSFQAKTGTTNSSGVYTFTRLEAGTYVITEISAPSGYQIDDPSPVYVTLPDGDGTTVTKTFTDTPTTVTPPSGTIRKVDKDNPTRGLAGATIAVQGIDNAFYGEFQTGSTGALEDLNWSELLPGNYRAWEVSAPEGYILDASDVKTFTVSRTHPDVKLVFMDDSKVKVQLQKTDNSNHPLPGAVFNVLKDGRIIATEATDSDGKILVTGVTEGLYTFVEVSAPAGYAKLDQPVSVHVDHAAIEGGGTITVSASDKKLPDLTIQKRDAGTGAAVPGTVFEIRGIGHGYQQEVTTGANGDAVLTGIPVGSYEVTEKSVPAPYVLGEDRTQTVWLEGGAQRSLVFTNEKKPTLNLLKVDALTSAPVPGTVFAVRGVDNSYRSDWTTGTDGTASETLNPGTYQVTEKSVPAPYYLPENDADRTQTVSLSEGDNKELVFRDYRTPEFTVYKADAVTGAAIAGAQFHVTYTSTGLSADAPASYDFGVLTTNAAGQIPLHETGTRLYPGQYTVTEVRAAEGYQIREPSTQSVILSGSESKTVTFYNVPLNAIAVQKYDSVTGQVVPGATFQLRYLSGTSGTGGTVIGTKTTDASGLAVWTDLEAGAYIVEEISPPPGYNMIQASETVYIQPNGQQDVITVTFYNAPDGSFLLRKIDSVTRQPLSDCEFLITDSTGAFVGDSNGRYVTNSAGIIEVDGIAPGTTLVVKETRTRPEYVLDDTAQTITIQAGRVNTLEFRNAPKPGLIVLKKDAVTGAPLPGVTFSITTSSGSPVSPSGGTAPSADGNYVTDADGKITLTGIDPGTYLVREVSAISGYVLDEEPRTVQVSTGQTYTLTVVNQPKSRLIVYKYDRATRQPLPGTEFTVTPVDPSLAVDNEGLTAAVYRTDDTGAFVLTDLTPAVYTVTEVTPPDDYALDADPQNAVLRAGATQTLSFYNTHLTSLTILKRDSVTHAPLAGAQFRVVDVNGDPVGTTNGLYTSGANGIITIPGLTPNTTLIVTEVSAPESYIKNPTPQTITVRAGVENVLTMDNTPGTTVIVNKFITGTNYEPLAGVEFLVTDSSGAAVGPDNGRFITDRTGQFRMTGLTPGTTITVREVRTAEGYVLDALPQTLLIKAGEVQTLNFWNARMGTLIVNKVDAETNELIPGTEFRITYADGRPVDLLQTGGSSGSSTGTGTASGTTSSGGATGGGSTVTSSNGRYVTDSRGQIVIPDITGTVIVTETKAAVGYAIDPDNRSQTVTIYPSDAQTLTFGNPRLLTLTIHKRDALTHTALAGAEFKVSYVGGAELGTFITGTDGTAIVSGLKPDTTLTVTEISAPSGYVRSELPQTVKVQTGRDNSVTFDNTPMTTVLIRKVIAGTENEPLANVEFMVTDSSGAAIGPDGGVFVTDRNGEARITGLAPGTNINIRETKTAAGFVLDSTPRQLLIQAGEQQTVVYENQRKGSLLVRKLDAATRQPLAGVEFSILYADGRPVDNANGQISSVGRYTTDENGEILISGIVGTLVVTEEKTLPGYTIDPDAKTRTVEVNPNDGQTLVFTNAPKQSLTIHKYVQNSTTPIPGTRFLITDSAGNKLGPSNGEFTTDANGEIVLTNLTPGVTVTAKEIAAADGYVLDPTPQSIYIRSGDAQSLNFYNVPKQNVTITKYVQGTTRPLAGVTFAVTDAAGNRIGEYVTDQNGQIVIPNMAPGTALVIRETKTVKGYVLNSTPQTLIVGESMASLMNVSGSASGTSGTSGTSGGSSSGGSTVNGNNVSFYDEPLSTLVVRKYVDGTANVPLSGVEFTITDGAGAPIGNSGGKFYTDAAGSITLENLEPGTTIRVQETKSVDGYLLDGTPQTIQIRNSDVHELVFWNQKRSTLVIRKTDAVTGQLLKGATFQVTTADGAFVDDHSGALSSNGLYTTGDDGEIRIVGLEPGVLVVKETGAPEGYVLNDVPQTVRVNSGETQTLTFANSPKRRVIIQKYAADGTAPIPGTVFLVRTIDGTNVGSNNGEYTTNRNGQIVIEDLAPGTVITAQEVRAASGYLLDSTPQSVRVSANAAQTMTFVNLPLGTLTVQKQDSATGQPLSGAQFRITDAAGRAVTGYTGATANNGIFTTDTNGQIVLHGLQPGAYVVTETQAPEGYVLSAVSQTAVVEAAGNCVATFGNAPKGSLLIEKYDTFTRLPLSGAEFRVTASNGAPVNGTLTTDANGQAVLAGLDPGSYTVTEIKAPDNYQLDTRPQTLEVKTSDAASAVFYNEPLAALTIRKVDAKTRTALPGAVFSVRDTDGREIGLYTTGEDGTAVVSGLIPNSSVVVTEQDAPAGYLRSDKSQTIKLRSGTENALTFANQPLGTLVIQKTIAGTQSEPLAGVAFRVTDGTGAAVGTSGGVFYTDRAGEIEISGLAPGLTVKVQEIETVPGFVLDGTPKTIRIQGGESNLLSFENARQGTLVIKKQDAETGAPLAGAEFRVSYADGRPADDEGGSLSSAGRYYTDSAGEITIRNITGILVVEETAATPGYVIGTDSRRTVTVNPAETQTIVFQNDPAQSLTVEKYETGSTTPIPGAVFLITDGGGAPLGNTGGEFVTDEHGRILLNGLAPGMTVAAKEIRAAAGYALDGTVRTATIQKGVGAKLTFYNSPLASLEVRKFVKGTENPIPGTRFLLTDGNGAPIGNSGGEFTTDSNGRILLTGLKPGLTVIVKEIEAADGYALDSTPKSITVVSGETKTLDFFDEPVGTLVIVKRDKLTNVPLAGAVFQVTASNGQFIGNNGETLTSNGRYTTNDAGEIRITGLEKATLVVKEIAAPAGYLLDDHAQTVDVAPNDTQTLEFFDVPKQTLTLQKYVTGTTTPLAGVKFLVRDSGGEYLGPNRGEYTTDANGQILLTGLTPGVTITAWEKETVSGYVLDSTPQSIKILSGEAQTMVYYNSPKGSLTIRKVDSSTEEPLSGAEFKVTTLQGVPVEDNEGQTSTGGIYGTNEDGEILLAKLQPGVYSVAETKAPDGYVLDSTAKTVTVNANDAQTVTFKDVPLQSVTIQKYIDGTTKPLAGVTFLVTDGNGAPVGGGSGEYVTDENGQIVISGLVPGSTIVAREVRTVKGYTLNGTPQTLVVGGSQTGTRSLRAANVIPLSSGSSTSDGSGSSGSSGTSGTSGGTLTFYDSPLSTLVVHKYIDGTDNEPLKGVDFKITDGSGKALGNSGGIFTTDETGTITVENIEPGTTVTVQEVKTVDGFVLDGIPKTVKIENSDVHELVFRNQRKGSLIVQKRAADTREPLAGAEFHLAYADGTPVDNANGQISSGGRYVTDSRGQIVVNGVTGVIVVTETKAPEGYAVDPDNRSQTVTVNANDAQTITFDNPRLLTLTLHKRDSVSGEPLEGAEFAVKEVGGQEIGTFITNREGIAEIGGLLPGMSVSVTETKAPAGYVRDSRAQSVKLASDKDNSLTFDNTPLTALLIRKVVAGTEDEPIPGVQFQITDSSGAAIGPDGGQFTTDQNGEIRVTGLTPGTTVVVRETKTADGFVLDAAERKLLIQAGEQQTITVENQRKGSLIVRKLDAATREPLGGVEFSIRYADGRSVDDANGQISSGGTYVTNSRGEIVLNGIVGTVVVTETKTIEGYTIDPDGKSQTVVVNPNDGQVLTFTNAPKQTLTLKKYVTGTTTPLPGVKFLVKDSGGEYIGPNRGEYVTDQNGEIVISNLTPGVTITAQETATVSGYVLDATPQSIKIKSGEAQTLVYYNAPKGSLTIRKLDASTEEPLADAEFKVTTLQGVPVDDNEGQTSTGGLYRTNEDGGILLAKLQPGVYSVAETKAPDGYVLDSTAKTVTVNANDAQTVTFKDVPLQSVTIQKYIDGTTKPLAGVTFLVTDGTGVPVGGGSGEYVTDANGRITISGLKPGTTITAREVRTVKGYTLNGTPQTLVVGSGGSAVLADASNASGSSPTTSGSSMTFYDEPLSKLIVRKVIDGTDGEPLQGVTFRVTDGSGAAVGNSGGEYVTDEAGTFIVENLERGETITVREVKTVSGFVLDGTPKTVKITNSDVYELSFSNRRAGSLTIQSLDSLTDTPIPGVEFKVLYADGRPVDTSNGQESSGGQYFTDTNGEIHITGIVGTVVVTEVIWCEGCL